MLAGQRQALIQDAGVLITDSGVSAPARDALADRIAEVVIAPVDPELRGTS